MKIKVIFSSFKEAYPPEELENRQEMLKKYVSPGVSLDFVFLGREAGTVWKGDFGLAEIDHVTPFVVEKVIEAEKQGFDACTLYGTVDAGMEEARPLVRIPVIGWGKATYSVATLLASKVGVIVYEDTLIPFDQRVAEKYHVRHLITSIRSLQIPLPDMRSKRVELKQRLIEACKLAINEGAELIYPKGISMVPFHYSPEEIEREIGVPVLNAMEIGIRMTELAATLTQRKT